MELFYYLMIQKNEMTSYGEIDLESMKTYVEMSSLRSFKCLTTLQ